MVNFVMPTHLTGRFAQDLATPSMHETSKRPPSGLAADIADLYGVALRDRWGAALVSVGWVHLAIFLVCQWLYGRGDRAEAHFLPLWGLDLACTTLIVRRSLAERPGRPVPSLFLLVARIWVTFLILAFSAASLNSLIGFQTDWFKAMWATLSTFGFATMAWIFHLKFLVPAVQMSLTALLIARFPGYAYGIYGLSWCLALNTVGVALERRRMLALEARREVSERSRSAPQAVDVG
jgi:hypothetical protein